MRALFHRWAYTALSTIFVLATLAQSDALSADDSVADANKKPPSVDAESEASASDTSSLDPRVLDDIRQLRREVGVSSLEGSILEGSEDDAAFDAGLLKAIQRPADADAASPADAELESRSSEESSPVVRRRSKNDRALKERNDSAAFQAPRQLRQRDSTASTGPAHHAPAKSEVIAMRAEARRLAQVANELEAFRQYRLADRLRDSAQAIRKIARALDADEATQPAPAAQATPATRVDLATPATRLAPSGRRQKSPVFSGSSLK